MKIKSTRRRSSHPGSVVLSWLVLLLLTLITIAIESNPNPIQSSSDTITIKNNNQNKNNYDNNDSDYADNRKRHELATNIVSDDQVSSVPLGDSSSLHTADTTSGLIVNDEQPSVTSRRRLPTARVTTQAPPATEERLLISITNDNQDRGFEDSLGPSSSSSLLRPPSSSSGGQRPPSVYDTGDRKPAPSIVTIAIQASGDSSQSGHRQNSGSSPSVIVRPTDSGQSIAIITTGSGSHHRPPPPPRENYDDQPPPPPPHHRPPPSQHVAGSQRPPSNSYEYDQDESSYQPRPPSSSSSGNYRPPTSNGLSQPANRPPHNSESSYSGSRLPSTGGSSLLDQLGNALLNGVRPPSQGSSSSASSHLPSSSGSSSSLSSGSPSTSSSSSLSSSSISGGDYSRPRLNEPNCGLMYDTRIVGGEETNPEYFQWMAAIIKAKSSSTTASPFCGGSLITSRHVLTAAHCLENLAPRDVLIRMGSYDFEDSASSSSADYPVDQFRVPAEYNKKSHAGDIAIMRLKNPIKRDDYKTVCMPQARRSYVGVLGTVIGYGSQSQTFRKASPKLRQTIVPVWENRKCSQVYKRNLTESFLCAGYEEGGKDACQGDSGGPLMAEGPEQKLMIIGVVSHGIGCGSPGYPGVYTRTSHYLDWIEKNTRE